MRMISVSSNRLEAVGYDERLKLLHIQFVDGSLYEYYEVPKNVYIELINASSAGKYFHKYIKGIYQFSKI